MQRSTITQFSESNVRIYDGKLLEEWLDQNGRLFTCRDFEDAFRERDNRADGTRVFDVAV